MLQGPVELDRLVPYVEEALQRSDAGIAVAVAGVSIGIDRDTHQLDLRAHDIRLSLPTGEQLASFPAMATSFSLAALFGGRIEPTRLVLDHPVLALTRDAAGALSFRVGDAGAPGQLGLGSALALLAPPRSGMPWSGLRRIVIRDATIIIDDQASGRVWRADRAAATLERSGAGASGDLSFAAALGTATPEIHVTYRYAAATQGLDLELAVDGLDPAALAPLAPALAPLADVQFPVSGSAAIRFNLATGKPEGGRLDLGFGAGRLATDLLASGRLPVAQGELHADYAPETAELRLEKLALDLRGGATLTVGGTLDGLRPQMVGTGAPPTDLTGTLGVSLTHVPASRIAALWPAGVSPGGRKWVAANVTEGMLDEMTAHLAVTVDPGALTAAFSNIRGAMRYHDLTVDYVTGLPPVKKVSGTATIGDRRLDFAIAGGALKSLKIGGGTASITNIGPGTETLTVDVGVTGGLQDALETIDAKPLRYAHEAGIDPARVGGKVDAQLHFKLPLLAALKLDDVDYGAQATLSGVSYAKVALDRPLSEGNFTLDLGHDGVQAKGRARFDDTPATIDGNLYFHPKTGPRLRYRIAIALDAAARQRLGWDFPDRLSGPVAADLIYTAPAAGPRAELDATLDLAGAALAVDEAGWQKPAGAPGRAKLVVALDDDVVTGFPAIDIKAGGLDGRFAATLNPQDRSLQRVDIRHLVIGDNDIAGTVSRRPGGGWQADLRAGRLDIRRLAKRALQDDGTGSMTPLAINARIAHLMLGPRREVQNVSAALLREGGSWRTIRIDGSYANGRKIALSLAGPPGNGRLHVESDDLGASFALFGIADNVVGGALKIDGSLADADGHPALRAHIEGRDYRLMRAPALARLLSVASLDGIAGMMSGSGIPFTGLRGDVSFSRGVVTLQRMTAYGGALGIAAKGRLDTGQDRIDIDGTLAPAYALNSALGNLPVLGSLLVGDEGQGLIAFRFNLGGSSDDPTVTVNPLSALTPGVLRHLFDPVSGLLRPGALPPPPP